MEDGQKIGVGDKSSSVSRRKLLNSIGAGSLVSGAGLISITTEYGAIQALIQDQGIGIAYFNPDQSEIPRGLEQKYSGSVGWPEGTEAKIVAYAPNEPIVFARTPTDDERQNAVEKTKVKKGEKTTVSIVSQLQGDRSGSNAENMKDVGEIWVQTKSTTTQIDYETGTISGVRSTNELFVGGNDGVVSTHATDCNTLAISCAVDLVLAVPNCGIALVGCSALGALSLGCALVIINICLPGAGVAIYSCNQYTNNC